MCPDIIHIDQVKHESLEVHLEPLKLPLKFRILEIKKKIVSTVIICEYNNNIQKGSCREMQ